MRRLLPAGLTDQEVFDLSVEKSDGGCWLCTRKPNNSGYAHVRLDGQLPISIHRLAWKLYRGEVPPGEHVQHLCNVRICANPYHLTTGSRSKNMRYMIESGRGGEGEKNPAAILTSAQVRSMREAYARQPIMMKTLAEKYGVSEAQISNVLRGRSHKKAGGPTVFSWERHRGERHQASKLTADDVREIRVRSRAGVSNPVLAAAFGITDGHVCNIVSNRVWKHVP